MDYFDSTFCSERERERENYHCMLYYPSTSLFFRIYLALDMAVTCDCGLSIFALIDNSEGLEYVIYIYEKGKGIFVSTTDVQVCEDILIQMERYLLAFTLKIPFHFIKGDCVFHVEHTGYALLNIRN